MRLFSDTFSSKLFKSLMNFGISIALVRKSKHNIVEVKTEVKKQLRSKFNCPGGYVITLYMVETARVG